jgi:GMP synthase-like glutamine amidotransferase
VRVLSIVHERDAGSGVFADAAAAWGAALTEWVPAESPAPPAERFGAVLVFGGAMNVDEEREHPWLRGEKQLLRGFIAERMPLLGVCLGAQLLCAVAGGAATHFAPPEIGWAPVELAPEAGDDELFGALPQRFESFQWHSYELVAPADATVLARSARTVQAFRLAAAPAWGVQFHAEATAATIAGWVEHHREDAEATLAGIDWAQVLRATEREIAHFNELGAGVCTRFLDLAARPQAGLR